MSPLYSKKIVIGVDNLEIRLLLALFFVGYFLGALVGRFVRRSRRALLLNPGHEWALFRAQEFAKLELEDQISTSARNLETTVEQMKATQEDLRQRNLILEPQPNASLDRISKKRTY